ncbi:MAG TPA: SDR family NAD(P)-dependent oxidoreductase [Nostocaceae cyanobacterium]|nr:SDR family NAD(P)-dependent oxidoreductase [Nostocaceae cyanobacterium]
MTATLQVSPSSVFVVSGGAKGITAQCTIKLAQHQPCKFILLGRSELLTVEPEYTRDCLDEASLKKRIMENLIAQGQKPTPMMVQKICNEITSSREIKKTLAAIQEAGATAEYISVDVTDTVALKEKLNAVTQKLGAITGIIHGAGNLADKLIEKKTEQDFEKVYTAKVQGLENLLACVKPEQIQHLVLFSSVTGFYGNIGQTDYAIANEILNKSAHLMKQYYPQAHIVAINWGGWDSGMVTPELKKAFAERGINIIPVEVGTQMLVNELHPLYQKDSQVVIGKAMSPIAAPLDHTLRTHYIRRRMTLAENPFLYDHVVAGLPVLPATCAISWMVNACEEAYPGYRYLTCKDFRVLKGITFNHTLAEEYLLELKELTKIDGELIEFQTTISSKTPEGKTHYHFRAVITVVRKLPEPPIYTGVDLTEDNIITTTGTDFYQKDELSLFHGPAFQKIVRVVNIQPNKITVECYWEDISDHKKGQFPVHWHNPYVIDLSTQSLWLWLSHFHQEICLPGQLENSEQFLPTPVNTHFYVSCEVKAKTDTGVHADIILHNREGRVYSQILGAKAVIWPRQLLTRK